jgi:hypothetical protein
MKERPDRLGDMCQDAAEGSLMAVDKDNRALRRFVGWLSEDDVEVIVWRTEDGVPLLVTIVDATAEPVHAVTLQVTDTDEGRHGG